MKAGGRREKGGRMKREVEGVKCSDRRLWALGKEAAHALLAAKSRGPEATASVL